MPRGRRRSLWAPRDAGRAAAAAPIATGVRSVGGSVVALDPNEDRAVLPGQPAAAATRRTRFDGAAMAHGALLMTGSTYITYVLGLVVSVLVARSLGPTDFGRYSYLVWLSGFLVVAANNGLTTTGIRFVSEALGRDAPQDAGRVHAWLRRRQFASLAVVLILFVIALPLLRPKGWGTGVGIFAAVAMASAIAKTMYLFDVSIAKGYGRFSIEAVSTIVVTALNAAVVAAMAFAGAGIEAFSVLFGVTSLAFAAMAVVMLRASGVRAAAGPLGPDLHARIRRHLLWTLVLVLVGALSNKTIETFLLNALIGPAEVGFFTIAGALTRGMVETLSAGLNAVLMPSMAHAQGAGGPRRVAVILSDSVRYFQFLGLLIVGAGVLWAGAIVQAMYGSRFGPVVGVFQVMAIVGGLTLGEGAFGALLTTTDHQRLRAVISAFSVLVSAVAAVALVPHFGLKGAVAAHAVSRLVIFSVVSLATVRTLTMSLPWRALGHLYLAALAAGAMVAPFVVLVPGLPAQVIAGAAYIVLFAGATILMRLWQERDIEQLQKLAARYPRVDRRLQPLLARWRRHASGAR
jgi:O-antigen/teichoic acid export membrane protein